MSTTTHSRNSRRSRKLRNHFNARDAARAIYLDFEGLPNHLPSLLGFACEGYWSLSIIDDRLSAAAQIHIPGGEVAARSADSALEIIRTIAERHNRKVCAWTEHDLKQIRRIYADHPEKLEWWEANLINIKPQAGRFVQRCGLPVIGIRNRRTGKISIGHQAVIMQSLCIDVPKQYGRGIAANGIKAMRSALVEHVSIDLVAEEIIEKWTATLLHNRYDCFGMAAIMCPVTLGLAYSLNPAKWVMDPHQC